MVGINAGSAEHRYARTFDVEPKRIWIGRVLEQKVILAATADGPEQITKSKARKSCLGTSIRGEKPPSGDS